MNSRNSYLLPLTLLVALLSTSIAAQEPLMREAAGEITWSVDKAFGTAQLVVSGPDGLWMERSFRGEQPRFSAYDELGQELPLGSYRWVLTVSSEVDDELRAQIDQARREGDTGFVDRLRAQGLFHWQKHTGHFVRAESGWVIPQLSEQVEGQSVAEATSNHPVPELLQKTQVFTEDLIVVGSECLGLDCIAAEIFGFDTLRLKEPNTRIKFQDTSTGNFPSTDWLLEANDSTSGGSEYFMIHDDTNDKDIFVIEANSPDHTLYVASEGRLGVKTSTPNTEVHVLSGNTPTVRLQQDTSGGYSAQTWDIGANEANFYVADMTHGSNLVFRIEPEAPQNTLYLENSGDVGLGLANPQAQLHVRNNDGNTQIRVTEKNSQVKQRVLLKLENNGIPSITLQDTSTDEKWSFSVKSDKFEISQGGSGVQEFTVDGSGNVTINGSLTTSSGTYPDYVFEEGYPLMPLDEVAAFIKAHGHLPNIKSEEEVEFGKRVDISELSIRLLEKVEELTLYTLDQHKSIRDLTTRLESLEAQRR